MKYIIIILLTILFMNCDIYIDDYFKDAQIGNGLDIYYGVGFSAATNEITTSYIIRMNIKQVYEGIKDKWSEPKITWERGYGDCDDIALLFANIMYVNTGIKCNIIATKISSYEEPDKSIVSGGIPSHIIVEMNGKTYSPYYGQEVKCDIQYRYTFDEVFNY